MPNIITNHAITFTNILLQCFSYSNRWDAVTNLFLAEKRQKELRGQKWVKRGYEKKRDEAKQVRRI